MDNSTNLKTPQTGEQTSLNLSANLKDWIKRNEQKRKKAERLEKEKPMYSRIWYEKGSGFLTRKEYYARKKGPKEFGWT